MVLLSMTSKEIWDNISADKEKVKIKTDCLFPKAVKDFRKERMFPAWRYYEYKIPSTGNQYIIFFYAANMTHIEKPQSGSFCVVFHQNKRFVLKCLEGRYRHTLNSEVIILPQVHIYTSHFFSRYKERYLKDESLPTNDVACRYFSRNKNITPMDVSEEINKNVEEYGDFGAKGVCITDGFCFTKIVAEISNNPDGNRENDKVEAIRILYTTYMPISNMHPNQRTAIEKEYKEIWGRLFIEHLKEFL